MTSSLADLSPVKLALLAQQVRAQGEAALKADPIAIIGMGCRLPGGVDHPEAFWRLLADGVDAVSEVPPGRWDAAASYDPDPSVPGKAATKWGGFLGAIDGFDPGFFGITGREADRMDPQQRLFLEVAIEALDHAGLSRQRLAGSRTGAFVASYHSDYAQLEYNDPEAIDARTLTGTVHSVLVNRLSYLLDLRGPSLSVDTACSSSLVAIHLACQSLRFGESDIALAGGVSLMISDGLMISLSKVGFMAPDGRCKTFDASADGFGRGEGCGVIVLKRLSDAVADGDRVLALIRGTAVNQDGHSTVLAAPNGLAQQALIREALANAQIGAGRIGYIEAHGTGTALGDPIEVEALAATVGLPAGGSTCWLGAAKANIGHLEAAAGVTGVIKSVLVLQHGMVPPQVHFKSLNPHISLAGTRLKIPTALTPWPPEGRPRCVGTSGFGVGGTNAHVILEEAPRFDADPSGDAGVGPWLVPLSAQSPEALRALAARWIDYLPRATVPFRALVAAAGDRRSHYDYRFAAVAKDANELRDRLRAFLDDGASAGWASGRRPLSGSPRVAFVFGGQGQQWIGMGRELIGTEPAFRDVLRDLDARFRAHLSWSVIEELGAAEDRSRLNETEVAQPVIFAVQVALAALWASWGVTPDGVVGHSIGEIAAFHVAGALSLEDAVRIVVHRGRVMQRATGHGAMAAVGMTEAEARQAIANWGAGLSIGAVNSPRGVVLSGEPAALAEVLAVLEKRGVSTRRLPVNYAFHSTQMTAHAAEFVAALGAVATSVPRIPLYSTVTGSLAGDGRFDSEYFGQNVRQPVRFGDAIAAMLADGFGAFVEIGAHPVLGAAVAECAAAAGETILGVASLRRGRPERESLLLGCATLYVANRIPDWEGLNGGPSDVVDLPAYPWQRERHWLRDRPASPGTGSWLPDVSAGLPELLGRRVPVAGASVFESTWPAAAPSWLSDHRVGGHLLMPGMAMLEGFRLAATEALGGGPVEVSDFVVRRPLVLESGDQSTTWQFVAQEPGSDGVALALHQAGQSDGRIQWHQIATAQGNRSDVARSLAGESSVGGRSASGGGDPYEAYAALGVEFGPAFRSIVAIEVGPGRVTTWLRAPSDVAGGGIHPAVLDGALQSCVAAVGGGVPTELFLPIGADRYTVVGPVPRDCRAEARWERVGPGSVRADIDFLDDDGRPFATISGASLVPADLAAVGTGGRRNDWLYQIDWRPAPASEPAPAGAWLIVGGAGGAGEALARALTGHGHACLTVAADGAGDLDRVLADSTWRAGQPLAGVVYAPHFEQVDLAALQVVQSVARGAGTAQVVFVTAGAAGPTGIVRPAAAGLWGLGAAAAVEHPELAVRMIDIDPDAPTDGTALAAEIRLGRAGPQRVVLRGPDRLVPRLHRRPEVSDSDPANVRLAVGVEGSLESLRWDPAPAGSPGPGEVRVRVLAAGINFRDVLLALGMIPAAGLTFGAECSGVVEATGPGVDDLQVGDLVFGFAPSALATTVVVPALFLARWPSPSSMEAAAGLPAAYLTAILGLLRIAGLKRGQRVLIHAGAGGVGLAAVYLARRAGAEIFATAGSPAKRELLLSLGVSHALDSRSLEFADRIRELTGEAGVDVVLNSLAGDFIGASVGVLAPAGCFLELGKRGVWSAEEFRRVRPGGRYVVYDLGDAARADPGIVRPMLDELLTGLADGSLPPLPVRVSDFRAVSDAFRFMAQGRHVGKLVLRWPGSIAKLLRTTQMVRPDGTYWVTGGLGALGLRTAQWLVGLGARHLVLTGRAAPSSAALAAIRACEALGATVEVRSVDAGDRAQMTALVDEIRRTMPPLRGVVHAAGALGDGVLLQQDPGRFAVALRGKAHGARLLDELTRPAALDFFVLYSAAGLHLGPAGQGPYAAANAELDAIAMARRGVGLPGLSVAWGQWQDGGMASATVAEGHSGWAARGLGWIRPDEGFVHLERLLRDGAAHAVVLPIDWRRFLDQLRPGLDPDFFADIAGVSRRSAVAVPAARAALAGQWRGVPESQRRAAVESHVTEQARLLLGLSPTTVLESRTPLKDIGLDSLMAVELRNALARSIGEPLPATLLFDHPSLDALTVYLIRHLKLSTEQPAEAPSAARNDVSELSEDEAEAQLLAELDRPTAGGAG